VLLLSGYVRGLYRSTTVTFLAVGQGDAILVQHGTYQVLIDTGRDTLTLQSHLSRHMPPWDRHIEVVVLTHPDADHIGGFAGLLAGGRYTVDTLYSPAVTSGTDVWAQVERTLEQYPVRQVFYGYAGEQLAFPGDFGRFTWLYPYGPYTSPVDDPNTTSTVQLFTFGTTRFLLTGDLPNEETYLKSIPDIDVLKAAHHGSGHSSSEAFLRSTSPSAVILSTGRTVRQGTSCRPLPGDPDTTPCQAGQQCPPCNEYSHPSLEVTDRLRSLGIPAYRTDQLGDITYVCTQESGSCTRDE